MPRGYKLPEADAAELIKNNGYVLVGEYRGKKYSALIRCEKHGFEKLTRVDHVIEGAMMACCAREKNVERGKALVGDKNPFFGKKHSNETRSRLSSLKLKNNPNRGAPMHENTRAALLAAITGKPRLDSTKDKLRKSTVAQHNDFDFCVTKAERGRTVGRPGWFYIADVNGALKFGSSSKSMEYRLSRLRQQYGKDVRLLLACRVDGCGQYEASMMRAHSDYWVRSEFFKKSLLGDVSCPT